uniref:VWFA domain-containing protein n=1 Tax=Branchiostoma floridae TaxID=7739 RepID=C4A0E7_BRAFL|eukprot:XP_002585722.1 hypothetical protein BRAFLDRAFT_133020 [Branchiostoma floridae]
MQFGSEFVYLRDHPDESEESVDEDEEVRAFSKRRNSGQDDGKTCMLDILDTAGQEEFSAMRDQYMRTGNAFILIFDVTSRGSLDQAGSIYEWLLKIKGADHVPAADGNVVLVSLSCLENETTVMPRAPPSCAECNAVLSHLSKIINGENGQPGGWHCHFCNTRNDGIEEKDIPTEGTVEYVLAPADTPTDDPSGASPGVIPGAQGVVVLCVDVSGSMGVTTRVPQLQAEWKAMRDKKAGKEYVTRLECMTTAITRHLERLELDTPDRQVAIVTFQSQVQLFGDGRYPPTDVTGDTLISYDGLISTGRHLAEKFELQPIKDSLGTLKEKVCDLSAGGTTALGPALAVCAGVVADKPRSEIILCTDGAANVGVGDVKKDPGFYKKNVALEQVSAAAATSGGTVNILHPLELVRQIRQIAQNNLVATDVRVTLMVHPALLVERNDQERKDGEVSHRIEVDVGNATKSTDMTFSIRQRASNIDTNMAAFPAQAQISFTRKDGARCLRVITMETKATQNREDMEKNLNIAVTGLAAVQKTSALAEGGKNDHAKVHLQNVERLLARGSVGDSQKEEHYIFLEENRELAKELSEQRRGPQTGASADQRFKNLYKKKHASVEQFLGGKKKGKAVKGRITDKKLNQQYYDYEYQPEEEE